LKSRTRNIFFLFGIGAIVVMILTFKVSFVEMWNNLSRAGYWLVAILLLWMVLYLMNTFTWRIIIRGSGKCKVPFWKLYKVTVTGFALNYATPAGLMGGEPYKVMELTPYIGRERATSSVLLFAMMHIFSHFWYWLTAVVLYVIFIPLDTRMAVILPLVALFSLSGIYLFVRGYRHGMVVKILNLVAKIPGCRKWGRRFIEQHSDELCTIDKQIAQLQQQKKANFFGSFLLEYIGRIMQSLEIFFMLRLVDVQGSMPQLFMYSLMILSFTSLFANLLFFMPLQIGGREGGFAMSTVQMKMSGVGGVLLTLKEAMTIAVFISIIVRIRELFWTAVGMLLMKVGTEVKIRDRYKGEDS
jgi:uncharacterized membrane protein YbhN (UPF0104 family)